MKKPKVNKKAVAKKVAATQRRPDKEFPFRVVLARFLSAHATAKEASAAMKTAIAERPDDVYFVMEMPR
jgi:hypothetical protein